MYSITSVGHSSTEASQLDYIAIRRSATLKTDVSQPECIHLSRSTILGTEASQLECIALSRPATLGAEAMLHMAVRFPVLLCAVKTVEGDFRFCWMVSPNVGQTQKENPNLVRMFYMTFTLNDIYKQYKLHAH